jgi:hypothetical protein
MARDSAGDPRRISVAERRARVVELRRQRWQFADIGREIGLSTTRAWQLYQEALRDIPAPSVAEHRTEETALADDALHDLMEITRDTEVGPRTRVEAWNSARGWSEHKARLLGLNAPVKVEVSDERRAEVRAIA